MGAVKGKTVIRHDERLELVLEGLRDFVDNMATQKVGFDYNKEAVQTVTYEGIEYGYKLEDHLVSMRRKIFIKTLDYKSDEIPHDQFQPIVTAVFKVFVIHGAALPSIENLTPNCILMTQDFIPMVLVNTNPNLVSKVGGFDVK